VEGRTYLSAVNKCCRILYLAIFYNNRVLRRIFGPKKNEVAGEWRKLHNEELHNLYSSPNIITRIKLLRKMWAGHVARVGQERNCTRFWSESAWEKGHSVDRDVDGRMGSEWILGRLAGVCSGFSWLRIGTSGGLL
jgi:hypothetical protein